MNEWATIILVIVTWLMSAALTYGIISTKVSYLEERVKVVEDRQRHVLDTYLTRDEYQRFHQILVDRLDKMICRYEGH